MQAGTISHGFEAIFQPVRRLGRDHAPIGHDGQGENVDLGGTGQLKARAQSPPLTPW